MSKMWSKHDESIDKFNEEPKLKRISIFQSIAQSSITLPQKFEKKIPLTKNLN